MCDKRNKKGKTQKVIVPQGLVREDETTVIEIPDEYKDEPVVVVTPKTCLNLQTGASNNSSACVCQTTPNESNIDRSQGCPNTPNDPRGSCQDSPSGAADESLGILTESMLNNTASPGIRFENTNRPCGIADGSFVTQNNSNSPGRILETSNRSCGVQDDSLGLLHDSQLNRTSTPVRQYENVSSGRMLNNTGSPQFSPCGQGQAANNESLGILNAHQMQTSIGSPRTVKTVNKIIITTTCNDNSSLGILNLDQLANNTLNESSLGTLGLQDMRNLSGTPPPMDNAPFHSTPNNSPSASTCMVSCQSGCATPQRGNGPRFTSTPNKTGGRMSAHSSCIACESPPAGFSDIGDSGYLPSFQNNYGCGAASSLNESFNLSPIQMSPRQYNTPPPQTTYRGGDNPLNRSLEDQLRVTEERESSTLQTDLRNYQEARRRLVTDTANLSSFNKFTDVPSFTL